MKYLTICMFIANLFYGLQSIIFFFHTSFQKTAVVVFSQVKFLIHTNLHVKLQLHISSLLIKSSFLLQNIPFLHLNCSIRPCDRKLERHMSSPTVKNMYHHQCDICREVSYQNVKQLEEQNFRRQIQANKFKIIYYLHTTVTDHQKLPFKKYANNFSKKAVMIHKTGK